MTRIVLGMALLCLLCRIAVRDWQTKKIINADCIMMFLLGAASVFVMPEVTLGERALGIAAASIPMFLISVFVPGAFGGGDIKLMAAAGVLLGWRKTTAAFAAAVFLAGFYILGDYLLGRKIKRKTEIAFGPFLCAGIAAAFYFSVSF